MSPFCRVFSAGLYRRIPVTFKISLLIVTILSLANHHAQAQVTQNLTSTPLAFTQNMGQWDERVLFRANAGGAVMWFTKEGVTYQFTRHIDRDTNALSGHLRAEGDRGSVGVATRGYPTDGSRMGSPLQGSDDRDSVEQLVLTAKFVGANPNPEVISEGQFEHKCNYFLGNDPSRWHTDVPSYEAITFKDIYPGINLKFYDDGNGQAAYKFIAAPGVDIAQIKVDYEGGEATSLDVDGRLILKTKWGDMIAAIKSPTNSVLSGTASFSRVSEKTIGFDANSASRQALGTQSVGLVYSTYFGGTYIDQGRGIAVDNSGNAYVTGMTECPDFPTLNPYDPTFSGGGNIDAFVTKFSPTGTLIYSTYLGGQLGASGFGIAVDGSGNACVTGLTGYNFPTLNAYQSTFQGGNNDVFVTKLSSSGNSLMYSTYLGGGSDEYSWDIAVDDSGNANVTGWTASPNFPTVNAYQATYQGGGDAFVTKLSSSGGMIFSTYLGGGLLDQGQGIAVDGSGNAYVTGSTQSSDFPTSNPYRAMYQGNGEAFVTKLSSSGNALVYSTFLGGTSGDGGNDIAVDGNANAYITGWTMSSDFPTLYPYQTFEGGQDVFVTKLSSSGAGLIYSTYLGGGSWDAGFGIAVDGTGHAYATGKTASSNFPTQNPYQATYQGGESDGDAFVTKLSSFGNALIYSTYLGGVRDDPGLDIAVNDSGYAYVVGWTNSSNFPNLNSYQTHQGNYADAFVTKLTLSDGCADMGFRPYRDGWQFENSEVNMWPQSWWQQFDYSQPQYPFWWRSFCQPSDFPDWPLFVSAFGESQCYYNSPPGVVIYKPSAVSRWFGIKHVWRGSCFGFAISSFLFFDGYLDIATEFPGNAEVYQVPIDDKNRAMINKYWIFWFGRAQQQHMNSNFNSTTPNQTLQACQEMFNDPTRNNRVLYLANNKGSGAHAVNPYRCEVNTEHPETTYVYVYDNIFPDIDTMRIAFDNVTDTWSYSGQPGWGGAKRLFLMDPISNYSTNPVMPNSTPPRDSWPGKLQRSISQYIEFYIPTSGNTSIFSNQDTIGYVADSLFSTLSDGMPIIPITGQETPPIGYYLPNRPWSIQLSGFTDSTLRLTAFMDSTVIAYTRNDVDSTQTDELKYGGNDSSIVVVNRDIVSHVYNLQVISIHPDSEIVVKIGGLTSEAGDSSHFAITAESGLRVDNYGSASTYSIRVEIAGPTVDTVFFHDSVAIAGNSSHVIVPDWRQNNGLLIVQVDSGIDGSIDDTLLLNNNMLTGVDEHGSTDQLPYRFELAQNYPNPFNPVTTIEYSIPTRSEVTIEIFNVLGQKVRRLVSGTKSAGSYRTEWNGNDDAGRPVSTGVYLYRFRVGDVVQTKKMLLLK